MNKLLGKDPATRVTIDEKEYIYMMTKDNGEEVYIPSSVFFLESKKEKCSNCGYDGTALHKHHVYGRKNSDETIILCANCHMELHQKIGWKL